MTGRGGNEGSSRGGHVLDDPNYHGPHKLRCAFASHARHSAAHIPNTIVTQCSRRHSKTYPLPSTQCIVTKVHYKPWLNGEDAEKCLFVSVHGYGKKERRYQNMQGGWFYPGSGETTDCPLPSEEQSEGQSTTAAGEGRTGAQGGAEGGRAENGDVMREGQGGEDEVLEDRGAGEEREGSGTSNGSGDHGSSSGAGTREATSMQVWRGTAVGGLMVEAERLKITLKNIMSWIH